MFRMFRNRTFGAKNVSSYRTKIEIGTLPEKDSITYEGLFSRYYFDTGGGRTEDDLVSASFCVAQAPNEMTDKVEKYVSLGLNTSEDGKNHREDLNLIIVLDTSRSMGSRFTGVPGERRGGNGCRMEKRKIEVAKEVIPMLLGILRGNERLGIILFNGSVSVLQPFEKVSSINIENLIQRLNVVKRQKGTNMELGYREALRMMENGVLDAPLKHPTDPTNNRIIFMTDAKPTMGGRSRELLRLSKSATERNVFTTYIGIGLDFNTKLANEISNVRGSNYYSVKNDREFRKILTEDFNYIVTPIAFNCHVEVVSNTLEVEKVYGVPIVDQNEARNGLIEIDSLSASGIDSNGRQGSIILLKLKDKNLGTKEEEEEEEEEGENVDEAEENVKKEEDIIRLIFRYEVAKTGQQAEKSVEFDFSDRMNELIESEGKIFQNFGIRKAVLLAKYTSFMRNYILSGVLLTKEKKERLTKFKKFFVGEMEVLGDKSLVKEVDAMDRIRMMGCSKSSSREEKIGFIGKLKKSTLGSGCLHEAVKIPEGVTKNEWLAKNVVDFFDMTNLLYNGFSDSCTKESCPSMTAGPQYEYLWKDPPSVPKASRFPAPVYVDYLMTNIEKQVRNNVVFPKAPNQDFPTNLVHVVKVIIRRLFRVYAHLYHSHFDLIDSLGETLYLNTAFKHFMFFVFEFNLIKSAQLMPLKETILLLLGQDYKYKFQKRKKRRKR